MKQDFFNGDLAQWIGREVTYSAPEEIGRASIRYFALALEDFNPLYRDEAFARESRHGCVIAPPTFICETNQYMDRTRDEDGYFGHVWRLVPPPGTMVLRGGNAYEFFQPLRPTDRVTVTWRIANVLSERTHSEGVLRVISKITYTNQNADLLAINEEEMLYVPVGGRVPEDAKDNDECAGGEAITPLRYYVTTSSMMAYGAATWDSHRYHYDADYARSLGHSSQFIDGQLLGALLARQLMDWAGANAFVRRLKFFRKSMAYPGDILICTGRVVAREIKGELMEIRSLHDIVTADGRKIVTCAAATIDIPAERRRVPQRSRETRERPQT